jgi:hypothetical protein
MIPETYCPFRPSLSVALALPNCATPAATAQAVSNKAHLDLSSLTSPAIRSSVTTPDSSHDYFDYIASKVTATASDHTSRTLGRGSENLSSTACAKHHQDQTPTPAHNDSRRRVSIEKLLDIRPMVSHPWPPAHLELRLRPANDSGP